MGQKMQLLLVERLKGACVQYIWLEGDIYKVITLTDSDPLGCAIYRHGAGCHGCRIGANCHSTGLFHTLKESVSLCVRACVWWHGMCVFDILFFCVLGLLCPCMCVCLSATLCMQECVCVLLPLSVPIRKWVLGCLQGSVCVQLNCVATEIQHQTMFTTSSLVLFILFTPVQSGAFK